MSGRARLLLVAASGLLCVSLCRAAPDFAGARASDDARYAADRVVVATDNKGLPFAIVDKKDARIYVFEPAGRLIGASPVLLGSAPGDDAAVDIANPIANPQRTTKYILTVVSRDGCTAKGEILVKVYSDIHVPNAFTPNGDGKNDVFYVLGGPQGSMIKNFSIYDRWGEMVFGVHDVLPGDISSGWNGSFSIVKLESGDSTFCIEK